MRWAYLVLGILNVNVFFFIRFILNNNPSQELDSKPDLMVCFPHENCICVITAMLLVLLHSWLLTQGKEYIVDPINYRNCNRCAFHIIIHHNYHFHFKNSLIIHKHMSLSETSNWSRAWTFIPGKTWSFCIKITRNLYIKISINSIKNSCIMIITH